MDPKSPQTQDPNSDIGHQGTQQTQPANPTPQHFHPTATSQQNKNIQQYPSNNPHPIELNKPPLAAQILTAITFIMMVIGLLTSWLLSTWLAYSSPESFTYIVLAGMRALELTISFIPEQLFMLNIPGFFGGGGESSLGVAIMVGIISILLFYLALKIRSGRKWALTTLSILLTVGLAFQIYNYTRLPSGDISMFNSNLLAGISLYVSMLLLLVSLWTINKTHFSNK